LREFERAACAVIPTSKTGDIYGVCIEPVTRGDLEELVTAIDDFIASDTKNVFVLKPLSYGTLVIWVHKDHSSLTERVIADELAQPAHPAHTADKHGYHEITPEFFDKEIKETQEFLFFPEMNTLMKQ
jgi:hypothetical protein